ncbi:MAG TPA: DUF962 domain-containing protein, partial [Gemmataceae bacterium]|nr:DUF962 domain-containing protein [Gemmataceae bacterium]
PVPGRGRFAGPHPGRGGHHLIRERTMTFDESYSQVSVSRHADPVCRLLHYLGLVGSMVLLGVAVWLRVWWLLLLLPLPAYLLAWLGHVFARNPPTFFEHPWWSFLAFWKMIASPVTGQV